MVTDLAPHSYVARAQFAAATAYRAVCGIFMGAKDFGWKPTELVLLPASDPASEGEKLGAPFLGDYNELRLDRQTIYTVARRVFVSACSRQGPPISLMATGSKKKWGGKTVPASGKIELYDPAQFQDPETSWDSTEMAEYLAPLVATAIADVLSEGRPEIKSPIVEQVAAAEAVRYLFERGSNSAYAPGNG